MSEINNLKSTNTSPSQVGQIEVFEHDEFENIALPWEIMIQPLDNIAFCHHKTYLQTPSIILYKEYFSSALKIHGLTPDKMLSFTIPLRLGKQTLYWNSSVKSQGIPASLPGGLDAVVDAGQVHFIILIKLDLLEKSLSQEQFKILKDAAAQRLLPMTEQALKVFRLWLINLLDTAQQHPEMFQHAAVLRSVEEDIIQQLLKAMNSPLDKKQGKLKSQQGFNDVLEYLREADLAAINIPDLCHKAVVSQRSLEYAFQKNFNMTPISFIRQLRLHAIRRILLTSHASALTISDTAHLHGIYDMGRFAATYKKRFGELPSQTLAKAPITHVSPFTLKL